RRFTSTCRPTWSCLPARLPKPPARAAHLRRFRSRCIRASPTSRSLVSRPWYATCSPNLHRGRSARADARVARGFQPSGLARLKGSRYSVCAMLSYLPIYIAAILEGEIYYSKVCADAVAGRLFWPVVLACGALGGATGDQLWFFVLRGRIHWLDRFPRLGRFRDRVIQHVHSSETGLVLVSRFLPGLRTAIPIACAYAGMHPAKFSVLNLVSAFAWA